MHISPFENSGLNINQFLHHLFIQFEVIKEIQGINNMLKNLLY